MRTNVRLIGRFISNNRRNMSTTAVPKGVTDLAGNRKGFDLIKFRAITILTNVSDGQLFKVLHIFCGSNVYKLLGNKDNFAIDGCSDEPLDVEHCK